MSMEMKRIRMVSRQWIVSRLTTQGGRYRKMIKVYHGQTVLTENYFLYRGQHV